MLQWKLRIAALAVVLGSGFGLGVLVESWRLGSVLERERADRAEQLRRQAEQHAATLIDHTAARLQLEGRLHSIDTTQTQELANVRAENARLADELLSAHRSLSVLTATPAACPGRVPAATGTAGVDDGAGRADIHPADARRVVAITGDADECAVRLTALQRWVREVRRGGNVTVAPK